MPDLHTELCPDLVGRLACPVCAAPMRVSDGGGSLLCGGDPATGRAHCFDGAASGYLPLAPRHVGGGDSKEAVRARTAFLSGGYYAPAAEAVVRAVAAYTPAGGFVLDAGCGEGYYSNRILARGYRVMGVDLSKFAVETAAKSARAARRHAGQDAQDAQDAQAGQAEATSLYAVGSVFELPVREGSFDTVTNIFAPCAPAEYARVLRSGGHLVVVGAGERHLLGLKALLYDDPYLNDPRRDLPEEGDGFSLVDVDRISYTTKVRGGEHIAALFSMTPYYWRTPRDSRERLASVEELETEVAFDIHVYQKH